MQHAYERLSVGLFSEELDEAIVLLFASLIFSASKTVSVSFSFCFGLRQSFSRNRNKWFK